MRDCCIEGVSKGMNHALPKIALFHLFIYKLVFKAFKVASRRWEACVHKLGPYLYFIVQIHDLPLMHVQ